MYPTICVPRPRYISIHLSILVVITYLFLNKEIEVLSPMPTRRYACLQRAGKRGEIAIGSRKEGLRVIIYDHEPPWGFSINQPLLALRRLPRISPKPFWLFPRQFSAVRQEGVFRACIADAGPASSFVFSSVRREAPLWRLGNWLGNLGLAIVPTAFSSFSSSSMKRITRAAFRSPHQLSRSDDRTKTALWGPLEWG